MSFWKFGLPFAIGSWLPIPIILIWHPEATPRLGWPIFCTGLALGCIVYDHFFGEDGGDNESSPE